MIRNCHRLPCTDFRQARAACSHCDFVTCLKALRVIFENILISRSETVAAKVLAELPPPKMRIRVLRTESGLKLRMPNDMNAHEECELLINYIALFVERMPVLTLVEQMEVMTKKLMVRCMNGDVALPVKRRRLRLLTHVRLLMLQRQVITAQPLRRQQALIGHLLHEPQARMALIWRQHLFWFHFNFAKRLLHLEGRAESASYLQGICWPDRDDYRRLIKNSRDSRVLVSIHMGDFFGAFRAISRESAPGRHAISLRRDRTENDGMQHFSADRISHTVYYHQQHPPAGIVSALRQGSHTLAILFDLREDFGSTVTVSFFGQSARFVKGPALLAIMGRSNIYPFVCFESQGRNCIKMASMIDARVRSDESLHQATVRITQSLVNLAESWIRQWPAQWKYLTALPSYFDVAP